MRQRLSDAELAPYTHWLAADVLLERWVLLPKCDLRTLDEYEEDQKCRLSAILRQPRIT